MNRRSSTTSVNSIISPALFDPIPQTAQNGGLFSEQQCRTLAKSIIETYDSNGDGICQTMQIAKWLVDCYRAMNKNFQPTATDIASYVQVVDRNRKGKISVQDLSSFVRRFFYNENREEGIKEHE